MKHSKLATALYLFYVGFTSYISIEVIYRGRSHWTMGLLGGICFLIIGAINQRCGWNIDLLLQMLMSAGIITVLEFAAGMILNVWLGLGIWDYSHMRLQLMGQISLLYTLLWIPLSLVAIFLDDWLRHFLFGEQKPHYVLLGFKFGDFDHCGC